MHANACAGTNPFPVTVPLNTSTAACGLAAAQQQHTQQLAGQLQQQAAWQLPEGGEAEDSSSSAAKIGLQQLQHVEAVSTARSPAAVAGDAAAARGSSCPSGLATNMKALSVSADTAAAEAAARSPARPVPPAAAAVAGGVQQRPLGLATWNSVPGSGQAHGVAADAAAGQPTAADGNAKLSLRGAHGSKHPAMPAATAQAGWVGFGGSAGSAGSGAASAAPQQQLKSSNSSGMPRVVVERGPAAAGGGGRAVGHPRQVAGGQAAAGGSRVSWGNNKGQT